MVATEVLLGGDVRGRLGGSETSDAEPNRGLKINAKVVNEEEAKHLAPLINSFHRMELHASSKSSAQSEKSPAAQFPSQTEAGVKCAYLTSSVTKSGGGPSENVPARADVAVDCIDLPPRPFTSAGSLARRVNRFHEIKEEKSLMRLKHLTQIFDLFSPF
ncbi:hypothetical protein PoB_002660000 [Plakobranchus ocellatus]|uniref:Uncharacterized protein n=1 Tax=Plakobranchus ocellatus TaxID=259542 RepID=A0AAV3ZY12_9GAST|nr:hypothetical protein PoB_002660000 [Plakobranchus ocellatus]